MGKCKHVLGIHEVGDGLSILGKRCLQIVRWLALGAPPADVSLGRFSRECLDLERNLAIFRWVLQKAFGHEIISRGLDMHVVATNGDIGSLVVLTCETMKQTTSALLLHSPPVAELLMETGRWTAMSMPLLVQGTLLSSR